MQNYDELKQIFQEGNIFLALSMVERMSNGIIITNEESISSQFKKNTRILYCMGSSFKEDRIDIYARDVYFDFTYLKEFDDNGDLKYTIKRINNNEDYFKVKDTNFSIGYNAINNFVIYPNKNDFGLENPTAFIKIHKLSRYEIAKFIVNEHEYDTCNYNDSEEID